MSNIKKYYKFKDVGMVEVKPIRAMRYGRLTKFQEVLYNDIYKGYEYYIINFGTHPCCYILLDKNNKYYGKDYDDIPLDVHGGLTFSSFENQFIDNGDKYIIGWDYAHFGDRFGCDNCYHYSITDHTWKTRELIKECIDAIDNLISIGGDD